MVSLFFGIKVTCFRCFFFMFILFLVRKIFRGMKNYVLILKYLEPVLLFWTIFDSLVWVMNNGKLCYLKCTRCTNRGKNKI